MCSQYPKSRAFVPLEAGFGRGFALAAAGGGFVCGSRFSVVTAVATMTGATGGDGTAAAGASSGAVAAGTPVVGGAAVGMFSALAIGDAADPAVARPAGVLEPVPPTIATTMPIRRSTAADPA